MFSSLIKLALLTTGLVLIYQESIPLFWDIGLVLVSQTIKL